MKFKIFGYKIIIQKAEGFDADIPASWSNRHQKRALKYISKIGGNKISVIKALRKYGIDNFGELPGLANSKDFVDVNCAFDDNYQLNYCNKL